MICLICKSPVSGYDLDYLQSGARIKCALCGEYRFSERFALETHNHHLPDSYIYSGAARENYEQGTDLLLEDLKELRDLAVVPKNPLESIDRILIYILGKINSADEGIQLRQTDRSIAYAKNPVEFSFFLSKARELDYIEENPTDKTQYRLTLNGWKHLAELPQKETRPDQAFVAMWFHKELEDAWENGLKPALKHTGYVPIRIDRTEHNEKIDDRIIAEIRRSGLLVADFTEQRGGVYFEAGFAMGLGIPVIWTCRDTDINKLHFDTRQYNHIVWTDADDLKEKLINRIEATLPNRQRPKDPQ